MVESTVARFPSQANAHTHKRCGKCGKMVARASSRCRRCGQHQRLSRTKLALVASSCMLAGMFAVALWSTWFPAPRPIEAASAVPVRSAPPAIATGTTVAAQITAVDLWTAYMRDPAAADRRYRDRSLMVSGIVRSIDRDFDGGVMVRLSTGGAGDAVNAKLATRDDPWALGVNRGKEVSLLCVGRGSAIGAPLLGSCSVTSS
jgi:hypothetical protein